MASSITSDQKARFIVLLRDTGNVSMCARAIGFGPVFMRSERGRDPTFNAEWTEAEEEAADALEQEARRRATKGVTRQRILGTGPSAILIEEQHYSDALLHKLLEANKPDKFANRSKTEISNPDGSLTVMTDTEVAAKLSSIVALAQARKAEQEKE